MRDVRYRDVRYEDRTRVSCLPGEAHLRDTGIGPVSQTWEVYILPLN